MRARTIWLAAGGLVAAVVVVLAIPQTRDALILSLWGDEAYTRCASQDPAIAIAGCTDAFARHPENTAALLNRAIAYGKLGQHELAIKDFESYAQAMPDDAEAHHGLAQEYGRIGQNDRAIAEYDWLIQRDPNDAMLLVFRGDMRRRLGDVAGADADLTAARKLDPSLPFDPAAARREAEEPPIGPPPGVR
jgi:predicted Zn-dependent protease